MTHATGTSCDDPAPYRAGSALLTNAIGLHARPSVRLTQLAKRFQAAVEFALAEGGPWLDAKSPVQVMRAKAPKGTTLHFRARGPDAEAAVAALVGLVAREFDEGAAGGAPGADPGARG
jgi:phosphocarrier protein HPr